jgi:hypothetical protein
MMIDLKETNRGVGLRVCDVTPTDNRGNSTKYNNSAENVRPCEIRHTDSASAIDQTDACGSIPAKQVNVEGNLPRVANCSKATSKHISLAAVNNKFAKRTRLTSDKNYETLEIASMENKYTVLCEPPPDVPDKASDSRISAKEVRKHIIRCKKL